MIPDIAYVILNFNPDGESEAKNVLESTIDTLFERKSKYLKSDVFLLDQGSPTVHQEWLLKKQNQYNFSSILLNRNIGISRALNLFIRTCKSPVIGLITSDVIITTGMDEDLYDKIQIPDVYQATPFTDKSDVDYQIWKPNCVYGDDNVDLRKLKSLKQPMPGKLLGKSNLSYLRHIGVEFNVMFWKRSIFKKVGYFDERWKAAYENNDFSLRCFLAGGCTALSMDSFVWHYHKITEKNKSREKTYEGYVENWRAEMKLQWKEKWANINEYIDIYKPLGSKSIANYSELYNKFQNNIYLPYEQPIEYF